MRKWKGTASHDFSQLSTKPSHIWAIRFSTTKWSTEAEKSQFLYHPEHWKWEQPVPHSQPLKLELRDQQAIFSSWLRTRRIHSKYSSKDNILAENNTAVSLFTREKKSHNFKNHGNIHVGRNIHRSSRPTPCSKQGHLQNQTRLLRASTHQDVKVLEVKESTASLGSVLKHPFLWRIFLQSHRNFHCSYFCPLLLVLSLQIWKNSMFFTAPFREWEGCK